MKFKVGDKVMVRSDLVVNKRYGGFYMARGMQKYMGKILQITYLDKDNMPFGYRLQEATGFWWSDEMLEPVEKTFDIGDIIYDKINGQTYTVVGEGIKVRTSNGYEFYRDIDKLSKTKPLQKITRKELAEKGYELVD